MFGSANRSSDAAQGGDILLIIECPAALTYLQQVSLEFVGIQERLFRFSFPAQPRQLGVEFGGHVELVEGAFPLPLHGQQLEQENA
mgnify:CR=1 FL=1